MSLLNYLNAHFYSEQEMSRSLSISNETLNEWQLKGIFPKAAYSIANTITCSTFTGLYDCEEHADFYPRGLEIWGKSLLKRKVDNASVAYTLFSEIYIESLRKCQKLEIISADERFNEGLEEQMTSSWQQFLLGKYGYLCLQGSVDEVAYIDLAKTLIDEYTEHRTTANIDKSIRPQLLLAMKLLNKALSHFAPHEQAGSMRQVYIEDLIMKYDLSFKR